MTARSKASALIAFVSGIFLLTSGVNGARTWKALSKILEATVELPEAVTLILGVLIVLGALGGITVLFGALMLWKDRRLLGRMMITIGVGIGLMGFIIGIILAFGREDSSLYISPSAALLGIVLSIIARKLAR